MTNFMTPTTTLNMYIPKHVYMYGHANIHFFMILLHGQENSFNAVKFQ